MNLKHMVNEWEEMIHNESSYTEMFKEEKNKHLCTFPLSLFFFKKND